MRKVFRWLGIILGVILGIAILALSALYYISGEKINRIYNVEVRTIPIPTDAESIKRGQHLVDAVLFCRECHGSDFSGESTDEGIIVGRIVMSNLTSGEGGVGKDFTDEDWIRAIRHGIGKDGKSLLIMPSALFRFLGDEDLGAVIAYIKSIPAVDKPLPEFRLGPMGRMFILQDPEVLSASLIDHSDQDIQVTPKPEASAKYGAYLANSCKFCHGENLAGGETLGAGLNLTPGGNLGNWTLEDFKTSLRTGVTPENNQLDPELMPWRYISQLDDMEMEAIWLYLQSIPAVETILPTPTE